MEEVVRYNFRLRPGRTAESALQAEWHRSRFLWNEAVHQQKSGCKPTFAKLSKFLTEARAQSAWLREGSQVAQQQTLRSYAQELTRSFTVKGRGRPVFKARKDSQLSLEYTRRGFTIGDGRLMLAKGISIPVVWSRELPSEPTSVRIIRDSLGCWYASFVVCRTMARKAADAAIGAAKRELIERGVRAGRRVVLVWPAYTSMTCSSCFARAKQRLELGERVFRCQACGFTADRDWNAARVILAVAERGHTRVEDVRQSDHLPRVAGSVAV